MTRLGINYSDWRALGCQIYDTHDQFIQLRNKILKNKLLDILYVLDNGYVGELIIVNLDCIEFMIDVGHVSDNRFILRHNPNKSISIEI